MNLVGHLERLFGYIIGDALYGCVKHTWHSAKSKPSGGLGAGSHGKFLKIRCSKNESEGNFSYLLQHYLLKEMITHYIKALVH